MLKTDTLSKNILLISALCLPLMNCGTVSNNVTTKDTNATNYNVSITKHIPNTRLDLAIEYQSVAGDGKQFFPQISGGTQSNPTVTRPAITTNNEFSIYSTAIVGKWNALKNPHVGINVYLGGVNLNSQVDIIEPTGKTTSLKQDIATMIIQRMELYFPLNDKLRITGGIGLALRSDTELLTRSVALEYKAADFLELSLGYKKWNYDYDGNTNHYFSNKANELNFNSDSDISLTAAGLLMGLKFSF